MSDNTSATHSSPKGETPKEKLSLKDYIRKYLFCDHDKAAEGSDAESDASRLEWSHDNTDRFWRKERDLGLSLTDSNGLKTLDRAIADVNAGMVFKKTESLHEEKPIEMDFFIKPDGYGPCITLSYAIPTGPGSMQVVYIGGSFAELAEKARAGLHRRPTLRTPSASSESKCKSLCYQTPAPQTEKKQFIDEGMQTEKVEPMMEKEIATALAMANVSEPGDEQIVKDLDIKVSDVPVRDSDRHT